jgi:hypothetical protein
MAVEHGKDSNYAKEMRKWEAHHTEFGPPGRPYTYRDFPARMYKAFRGPEGRLSFESFEAGNEDEARNFESRGFRRGQAQAFDALTANELEASKLAAEINYDARRLSLNAQLEIERAQQAAGARHLPSIPETPIKKRGRKPKTAIVSTE